MCTDRAKTTLERQKKFRADQKERGLKEIRNLWVRPEDHEKIKKFSEQLNNHRFEIMTFFEIQLQGEMSERIESDSEINAVLKFAKSKNWGSEIGARRHSQLQSSQYTVGSNKNGWYQIWVRRA